MGVMPIFFCRNDLHGKPLEKLVEACHKVVVQKDGMLADVLGGLRWMIILRLRCI